MGMWPDLFYPLAGGMSFVEEHFVGLRGHLCDLDGGDDDGSARLHIFHVMHVKDAHVFHIINI